MTDNLFVTFIARDHALILTSGLSFLISGSEEYLGYAQNNRQPAMALEQLYLN